MKMNASKGVMMKNQVFEVATALTVGALFLAAGAAGYRIGYDTAKVGEYYPSEARHTRPSVRIYPEPGRVPTAPTVMNESRGDVELTALERAIVEVESRGDPRAIGDNGMAIGLFQIWPIMVKDCNRIVGEARWTDEDRWDLEASRDMFRCYTQHYWPNGTDREWATGWNGGPKGPTKAATLPYWQKVQKELR